MSRQRQNFGAVGEVTRAIVVVWASLEMVIFRLSTSESGCSQVWQSPSPASKAQAVLPAASCARRTVALIRSVSLGTSVLPRVATEIVCRARLIVTRSEEHTSELQ